MTEPGDEDSCKLVFPIDDQGGRQGLRLLQQVTVSDALTVALVTCDSSRTPNHNRPAFNTYIGGAGLDYASQEDFPGHLRLSSPVEYCGHQYDMAFFVNPSFVATHKAAMQFQGSTSEGNSFKVFYNASSCPPEQAGDPQTAQVAFPDEHPERRAAQPTDFQRSMVVLFTGPTIELRSEAGTTVVPLWE